MVEPILGAVRPLQIVNPFVRPGGAGAGAAAEGGNQKAAVKKPFFGLVVL
ncbi:predicted protein [Plenodomus lingam JN3]|uniref:Uncharacterized protein n=1 Tax=Leptosphaeria maculans (strain JN3 / isolate v23.1.3 / race Av1-4-5-6-7-8) TaxID=985895 RepID=E5A764_LEPMJ|nr:predicted protein [Plenodomus lingam JN3]CBX99459.1 predicted protein [Plenodomus lingam JN3]